MAKKRTAKLSQTSAIEARAKEAEELELKKLGIKREMEKIMAEYSKITGFRKLRMRRFKVGDAPNDWRKEDHRLNK